MESIGIITDELEDLMYGHNYEVKIKVHVYDHCLNINEFYQFLKRDYPEAKTESIKLIPVSVSDFWSDIDSCLRAC